MKKILILDDDATFAESMTATLEADNYEVKSAADGIDGLKLLETFTPDAILLDVKMPRMGGLEFLRKVNEKFGEGKMPVLITSNSSSLDTISEGVELGIRGYVVKSSESLSSLSASVARLFP